MADTAAIVALADITIAVDTSVAHLAGALGREAWVLLPFSPDWRWTLSGEHSPWYPQVRLLRQSAPGDWPGVVAAVRDALCASAQRNDAADQAAAIAALGAGASG
jgi:ADP-heptose:LPS heptosyltransferase